MASVTSHVPGIEPLAGVTRAPFLLLSVALVASGAAAAAYGGAFDPVRTLVALAGLVALHAAVNVLNEASDYESGIDFRTDPTPFSGGSKTLPEGELGPRRASLIGYGAAAFGAIVGLWFLWLVGAVLVPFIVVGAVCVLAYTDYLTKYGVGEVAAGLGLGALPVAGTALVQAGDLTTAAVAVSIPAFFLTFNLVRLKELPDQEADRHGGRRNLVHRFGREGAALIFVVAAIAVPVSIAGAIAIGVLPLFAAVGVLPSALLVRPVDWAIQRPESSVPVAALRDNVIWIVGTNALLAVGLLVPILY